MPPSQLTYLTYLLRLWRADETTPWRASLQDPHTGDKHNFASLGLMMDFLTAQAGEILSDPVNSGIAHADHADCEGQ